MGTLVKRCVFGLLFLVVVIGCLQFHWGVTALVAFLCAGLAFECYRLLLDRRFIKEAVCVTAGSLVFLVLLALHYQLGLPLRYSALGILPVVLASVLLLFDAAGDHAFPTAVYFPIVYVTLPLACALPLAWPGGVFSGRLLLGIFVMLWLDDIGAYVFGMGFGQRRNSRKLFPALSPKKSWIGAIGGTVCCFLAAWIYGLTLGSGQLTMPHWLALAAIVSVFGVFGDLYESLIKRHADVKDAGHFLPGHGGLLDRFDDVLFVLPLAALYLTMFSLL